MKRIKLNYLEMSKINGGNTDDTGDSGDACANVENCGCSETSDYKASYTKSRNAADSAWGA